MAMLNSQRVYEIDVENPPLVDQPFRMGNLAAGFPHLLGAVYPRLTWV